MNVPKAEAELDKIRPRRGVTGTFHLAALLP